MVRPHLTRFQGGITIARALGPSITQSTPSHQYSPNRQLRRWLAAELQRLRPQIVASAARCQAERYRKHFDSFAHFCLLLFHGFSASQSLRESYADFGPCSGLLALSGLGSDADPDDERLGVSYSQFALSNTTRPAAFLSQLIPSLVARVRQYARSPAISLPPELQVLDSTFLRLSLLLAPWLPNKNQADVPGVRLQVRYTPALDLPEHVLITDTRSNDCQGLDQAILDDPAQLASLRDQTLAIDLGYYSHRRFQRLLTAGVHFVSRLQQQAMVRCEADLPVQQPLPQLDGGRISLLRDQQVTLGSPNNRAGAVLPGLRLVTARVQPLAKAARRGAKPVTYQLLTDRWDLSTAEVVQFYLWRWQIELFFRWLKSHLHLPRVLGYSRNAVELTVWLAIVVHLLTLLAMRSMGLARRVPGLLRKLGRLLSQLVPGDLQDQAPSPQQLAFPGWNLAPDAPT